jgi:hypothetical protein
VPRKSMPTSPAPRRDLKSSLTGRALIGIHRATPSWLGGGGVIGTVAPLRS